MIQRLVDEPSVECCYVTYIISLILSQHRKYSLMCRSSRFNSSINFENIYSMYLLRSIDFLENFLQGKKCVQSNLVSQTQDLTHKD